MRKLFLFLCLVVVSACSKEQSNPTTCAVSETPEGLFFRCIDKDGRETSGLVKNGENGAKGEPGEKGEAGKGLQVISQLECSGFIEGWMEGAGYQIDYAMSKFETGAVFVSSRNQLMRGKEVVNEHFSSAFFINSDNVLPVSDGIFEMSYDGKKLKLKSRDGSESYLQCVEKK